MKKLTHLSLILSCLIWQNVSAQDKIYKNNGEIIDAKVLVVGIDEIKYHLYPAKDGQNTILKKVDISKIEYKDGRKEIYAYEGNDPELYAPKKTSAIKVNFFSPMLGYTAINYEKSIKAGRSIEFSVGLIGLGIKQELNSSYSMYSRSTTYLDQAGVYAAAGYKFIKVPKKLKYGAKPNHLLQGLYLKPQIMFGSFKANRGYIETIGNHYETFYLKKTTVFGGLLINIGKQWVFDDFIMIDLYGGAGYDINNQNKVTGNNSYNSDDAGFHYGVYSTHYNGGSGIGLTGGLKVGILVGK